MTLEQFKEVLNSSEFDSIDRRVLPMLYIEGAAEGEKRLGKLPQLIREILTCSLEDKLIYLRRTKEIITSTHSKEILICPLLGRWASVKYNGCHVLWNPSLISSSIALLLFPRWLDYKPKGKVVGDRWWKPGSRARIKHFNEFYVEEKRRLEQEIKNKNVTNMT